MELVAVGSAKAFTLFCFLDDGPDGLSLAFRLLLSLAEASPRCGVTSVSPGAGACILLSV